MKGNEMEKYPGEFRDKRLAREKAQMEKTGTCPTCGAKK